MMNITSGKFVRHALSASAVALCLPILAHAANIGDRGQIFIPATNFGAGNATFPPTLGRC